MAANNEELRAAEPSDHQPELPAFAGRLDYYEEQEYRGDLNFTAIVLLSGGFWQILWQLRDVKLLGKFQEFGIDPRARISAR